MNTTQKSLTVLGIIVLLSAIYGAYQYPVANETAIVGQTPGTNYTTQKSPQVIWAPASASASTTSILNSGSEPLVIESFTSYCDAIGTSGTSVSAWSVTVATSSVATNLVGNTNFVLNTTIATTTAQNYLSTTTPGNTGSAFVRVWGAGTYLVFSSNSVNTAVCNVGVNVLTY